MNLDTPHRRLNPLTGDWVLVSPHRARRPWLGQIEKIPSENLPAYDPDCYLCPGNKRAEGKTNPKYTSTYVFDNDFPTLLKPEQDHQGESGNQMNQAADLFSIQPESGLCRVVCFSPRHDLTLPELSQPQVEAVVNKWAEQTIELGQVDFVSYVQIFENKGAVMGCSNPHPHSQIWASSYIPNEPAKELGTQSAYMENKGECLLCDYLKEEQRSGQRLVAANEHFTALVPFWAVWPFELLLVSNSHCASLPDLPLAEAASLADIIRRITARYDNLFEISFPYSMGFHQAPTDGAVYPQWHLHAHYYPPLLRSATVRKFMVGYEMLGMPQRDLMPETAADRLRSLSDRRFQNT
jgi:UDPglucose--hexose-1-phosphate uridylyltransferase